MKRLSCLLITSLMTLAPGCAKEPLDTNGGADDGTTAMDDGTTGMDDGGTSDGGESSTSDGGTSTSTTTSTDDGPSFLDDGGVTTDPGEGGLLPLGGQCGFDGECESGICNQPFPGFGICSECGSDADCQQSGDGVNCTIGDAGYYTCSTGNLGEECESDAACSGDLTCELIVSLGGFIELTACSNCGDSSECDMGNLCAPVVDLDGFNLGGYRDCVAPGSIPNDSICDDTAEGDLACAGLCAPVDTGFGADIPICGDCETDADCAMGETCVAGMAGQGGLAGNSCQ